ncbi:MAG: hypothetical protein JWO81_1427 [Alphaproteobacteria bacterium]|nr:hypothetical protein [Alphaproteobacteria bacterium]
MALADRISNGRLLLRTIRGTFDFSGRSRRTEMAWYWLGSVVLVWLGALAATSLISEQAGRLVRVALTIVSMLPWFALFTRRLHDQDMSGWWTLLLVALFAICTPQLIAQASPYPQWWTAYRPSGLLTAIGFILVLAALGLTVAPETVGPNRFGPDPREGD